MNNARESRYTAPMTPGEKNIVKSLVAIAWADGKVQEGETAVIEGLLAGFDATEAEEREILEYARTRRTLENDIPLQQLSREERELLIANAALLTHADGEQTNSERALLNRLIAMLGFTPAEAQPILRGSHDGAVSLRGSALKDDE
jgi:tellurite resistance protein